MPAMAYEFPWPLGNGIQGLEIMAEHSLAFLCCHGDVVYVDHTFLTHTAPFQWST